MRSVIFDLDGTLVDSALLTLMAFRSIGPRYGFPIPSPDVVRSAIGYANPEFYERIYPDLPKAEVHRFGELIEREELRIVPSICSSLLFPGCRELLKSLEQRGVCMYIASTGSEEHVSAMIDGAGIRGYFQAIYCGQPDKVEMLRDILGDQSPGAFVMLGDKQKDCEGAHTNGILAIGAEYGYCRRGEADFDAFIGDPMEILEKL